MVCLLLGLVAPLVGAAAPPLAVIDLGAEAARYEGVTVAVDNDALGKTAMQKSLCNMLGIA